MSTRRVSASHINEASRIPASAHNPHLLRLMSSRITSEMVIYVSRQVVSMVPVDSESPPISRTSFPDPEARLKQNYTDPSEAVYYMNKFIAHIVTQSNVQVATLLSTLIYLDRLRGRLPAIAKGMESSRHRIFLSALIVSAKYLNDSSPRNTHWATHAVFVNKEQINAMEREMLYLLDFDLRFDELEACSFFAPFMTTDAQVARTRALAVDRVTRARQTRAEAQQTPAAPAPAAEAVSAYPESCLAMKRGASRPLKINPPSAQLPLPSPMHSSCSSRSSSSYSTASSDMGSLVDDNGSSSGSSSGWTTSDSDSEVEEQEPRIYSSSHFQIDNDSLPIQYEQEDSIPEHLTARPFLLRPLPQKQFQGQNRSRIPSDTSVCTIMASPPSVPSQPRRASKRSQSVAFNLHQSVGKQWSGVTPSTTMPTLPRTGVSGGFLSRMWGAARGQPIAQDIDKDAEYDNRHGQGQSALRRLVLSHSRAAVSRGVEV